MSKPEPPQVDYTTIKATAPSKFILSGEYAVVFDKQAIACAINLKTTITVQPNKEQKVQLNLKSFNQVREWPVDEICRLSCKLVRKPQEIYEYDGWPTALNYLIAKKYIKDDELDSTSQRQKMSEDATKAFILVYIAVGDSYRSSGRAAINITVESDIPPGSGLGSSSSYGVALCGAMLKVYQVVAENHIIASWAFNVDKYFHGKPSGIDTNTVTHGGCILFQSAKIRQKLAPKGTFKIMLIDSGISRSTKKMLEQVTQNQEREPRRYNDVFNNIGNLTNQIWRAINEPTLDKRHFYQLLTANQELLDNLGVGHPKLDQIIQICLQFDICCKLTGAGGGGFCFAVYTERDLDTMENIKSALNTLGYRTYKVEPGCGGLQVTKE